MKKHISSKKVLKRATDIVRLQWSLHQEINTPVSLQAARTVETTMVAFIERLLHTRLDAEVFLKKARDFSRGCDFGLIMAGDHWRPLLVGCGDYAWGEIVKAMNRLFDNDPEWCDARDWILTDGTPTREPAITYIVEAEPKLETGGIYHILEEILREDGAPPPYGATESEVAGIVAEQEEDEESADEFWADDINGNKPVRLKCDHCAERGAKFRCEVCQRNFCTECLLHARDCAFQSPTHHHPAGVSEHIFDDENMVLHGKTFDAWNEELRAECIKHSGPPKDGEAPDDVFVGYSDVQRKLGWAIGLNAEDMMVHMFG